MSIARELGKQAAAAKDEDKRLAPDAEYAMRGSDLEELVRDIDAAARKKYEAPWWHTPLAIGVPTALAAGAYKYMGGDFKNLPHRLYTALHSVLPSQRGTLHGTSPGDIQRMIAVRDMARMKPLERAGMALEYLKDFDPMYGKDLNEVMPTIFSKNFDASKPNIPRAQP